MENNIDLSKKIEERKQKIKQQIESKEKIIIEKQKELNELTEKNNTLTQEYKNLIEIIATKGLIIKIPNTTKGIKEWDNLVLFKNRRNVEIRTKQGHTLFVYNKEISDMLENMTEQYPIYSLIVTRVYPTSLIVRFTLRM